MGEHIITENTRVQTVSYSLPNKHYIPVDMRYIGIDNLTPSNGARISSYPEQQRKASQASLLRPGNLEPIEEGTCLPSFLAGGCLLLSCKGSLMVSWFMMPFVD
ncbi:hypothetical protein PHLCEN_2v3757 [Hermanssonia centrifuga]|uniref:Uncharacterized protein n=1 Tax=Hermanssonia centrifuga TaxID=98765 RepID=A0A2R6QBI2_9APHY|nr:hypothetical protein PHLCEN_2v3757 [Hermanssonia centrifuga]